MSAVDQTRTVRPGEELDVRIVEQYLLERVAGLQAPLEITQFPGGASNLTYLLKFGNRELVLRRPPPGRKAKSAHDMGREFQVMQGLRRFYPYVPEMVVFCDNEEVIGSEFYVMERLQGIILRTDLPAGLHLTATDCTRLCRGMIDRLVELHKVRWSETPLHPLYRKGDYVERQITGWTDRYVKARTPDVPSCSAVMTWLQTHRPAQIDQCLVHNDYRFDNLVLSAANPMDIIGVLDWEMATIGDPLMDLGNSLAYWVERDDPPELQLMRRQPSNLPGMLSRRELVALYLQQSGWQDKGLSADQFDFYLIYGVFRLVVIMQQIYYRYYHGQTRDQRFAGFVDIINYLDSHLQNRIAESRLRP